MANSVDIFKSAFSSLTAEALNIDTKALLNKFMFLDFFWGLLDTFSGSTIVPVPEVVRETILASNRMCRFVLDSNRETHLATGYLVGPKHVLTAAHLFFHEDGTLIDPDRRHHLSIEFPTLLMGNNTMASGAVRETTLVDHEKNWLIDPEFNGSSAGRDVKDLDFAIVCLKHDVGNEQLGIGTKRGWFRIHSPENVPTVAAGSMIKIFQYVDQGVLQSSVGCVTRVSDDRKRLHYTASTLDGTSGSVVLNDQFQLVAVHTGGPDDLVTYENRGVPIARAATILTARGILASTSPPLEPIV